MNTIMSVIIIHGGVETNSSAPYLKVLQEAALAGYKALGAGSLNAGHLDAAEEAVKVLEDNPLFNAGYGSVLNLDGEAEMDASIMNGSTGSFGAVAAIKSVRHPVSVARQVMEQTPHVLLVGRGATKFARSRGFIPVNCVAPEMLEAWQKAVESIKKGSRPEVSPFTGLPGETGKNCDTVGCLVSHQGSLAAASSTGGSFLKLPGRVGDTPVIGGGIFASPGCAVVCTGLGEAFIETMTAKYIDSLIAHGLEPQEAVEKALQRLTSKKKGARGGILAVNSQNRYGAAHNTCSFPVALMVNGNLINDFTPRKIT